MTRDKWNRRVALFTCVHKYWCYHLSQIQRINLRFQFKEKIHAVKFTISSCVFLNLRSKELTICNFKRSVVLGRVHNLKRTSYNAGLRSNRHILQQPKQKNWNYFYSYFIVTLYLCYFYVPFFVLSVAIMTPFLLSWLETVSSTFQQLYFDGLILHVPLFYQVMLQCWCHTNTHSLVDKFWWR